MKKVLILTDNNIIKDHFLNKDPFFKSLDHYIMIASSKGYDKIDLSKEESVEYVIDNYDLVISLHCIQIFPKSLYENVRCINLHPGYNPHNRGYFPHVHSIINGKPAGITIHEINGIIDGGDVIYQEEIKIEEWETSKDAYDKIIIREIEVFKELAKDLIEGNYITTPIQRGNYNSMKDYNELCDLDMMNVGTLKDHINVLRALTHPPYNNAYFYDENGNKIHVKITLEKELK